MNKQELIKHFEEMEYVSIVQMGKKAFIDMIEQLDEPQKTVVPQFVADWIETCKENNIISLSGAFEYAKEEVDTWLSDWTNQETFARAWLDGYEIEEEKRYLVKVKGVIEYAECLKYGEGCRGWMFGMDNNFRNTRNAHTKNQLEEAGFGWVFDCEGIEIEEVKDES